MRPCREQERLDQTDFCLLRHLYPLLPDQSNLFREFQLRLTQLRMVQGHNEDAVENAWRRSETWRHRHRAGSGVAEIALRLVANWECLPDLPGALAAD